MTKKQKKRGPKFLKKGEKKNSVTFYIEGKKIQAVGGMKPARKIAHDAVNELAGEVPVK